MESHTHICVYIYIYIYVIHTYDIHIHTFTRHVIHTTYSIGARRTDLIRVRARGAGESYAPQSSQIFGVLNTMLEDFEA